MKLLPLLAILAAAAPSVDAIRWKIKKITVGFDNTKCTCASNSSCYNNSKGTYVSRLCVMVVRGLASSQCGGLIHGSINRCTCDHATCA